MPQQYGAVAGDAGVGCGVFMALFAIYASAGLDFDLTQEQMPALRRGCASVVIELGTTKNEMGKEGRCQKCCKSSYEDPCLCKAILCKGHRGVHKCFHMAPPYPPSS